MASLHKHKMAARDSMLGSDVSTSFSVIRPDWQVLILIWASWIWSQATGIKFLVERFFVKLFPLATWNTDHGIIFPNLCKGKCNPIN